MVNVVQVFYFVKKFPCSGNGFLISSTEAIGFTTTALETPDADARRHAVEPQ